MDPIATDHSEPKSTLAQQAGQTHAMSHHPGDRFADARRAKKKAKRVRHRAKLKRSNTKG